MSTTKTTLLVVLGALGSGAATSLADVVTDGSVGAVRSLAGPNYQITSDLGRQVGGNVFHSFTRLNLVSGEAATFSGPGSITNIIGRVTGGAPSSIDGTIRSTIPGANLFLTNPS